MSTSLFSVTEHVIPCQHIREYPHAAKAEQAILNLAIKEYRPLNNLDPAPGSITFLAAHANGLPKETYEPLWDDFYDVFGHKIRAIWIADSSHQGASGVLNEDIQGDDPSWFDHSRDLLSMVNHFRERMPRPIFGIAHSMGAVQLLNLSLMHPRLFHSLALIEPILQRDSPPGPNAAFFASYRPDLWPSREEAEASFRKNSYFRSWEPRVLEKYCQYGLRDTPTALHPTDANSGAVTLTTSKHQEAWSYVRPNFTPRSTDPHDHLERLISPDLDPSSERACRFSRAEPAQMLQNLPYVRPSILWIFGSRSRINPENLQDEKMARTGTGTGGNGGVKAGRVEKAIVENGSHMLPFEKVQECAVILGPWFEKKVEDFEAEETFHREHRRGKSEQDMLVMSKQWLTGVRAKPGTQRPIKEHL